MDSPSTFSTLSREQRPVLLWAHVEPPPLASERQAVEAIDRVRLILESRPYGRCGGGGVGDLES